MKKARFTTHFGMLPMHDGMFAMHDGKYQKHHALERAFVLILFQNGDPNWKVVSTQIGR